MTKSVSPITPMAVLRLRVLHWGLILAIMVLVLGTACSSGDGRLLKLGGADEGVRESKDRMMGFRHGPRTGAGSPSSQR